MKYKSINVLGTELKDCSCDPMTGFFRDGCCNTSKEDFGIYTVCIIATKEFLDFSKSVGNDLSTDNPLFNISENMVIKSALLILCCPVIT